MNNNPILLDFSRSGYGDVVIGCWIINSANFNGISNIKINAGNAADVCRIFGIRNENAGSRGVAVRNVDSVKTIVRTGRRVVR